MSQVAIALNNVSKCFKRYHRPVDRLKELLFPGKSRAEEFWALQQLTLDIYQGETVGIVGRNGAGKSTLLQMIAGTLTPTTGEIKVNGRISALLELGSGFNPEFTGRQNVFFNGRLLGLTNEEIASKFEEIVEFSEIGSFLEQPVKTYSSGMFVRLAFAVAVHVNPQILIVDEALAVGDIKFQFKCFSKFKEFKEKGITILFVSHDSNSIKRYCDRAILIHEGEKIFEGTPNTVINYYTKLLFGENKAEDNHKIETSDNAVNSIANTSEYRYGNDSGEIVEIYAENSKGETTTYFDSCETTIFTLKIKIDRQIEEPVFAMTIKDQKGEDIYITNTDFQNLHVPTLVPGTTFTVSFKQELRICPGDYFISFGFVSLANGSITPIDRRYDALQIKIMAIDNDRSSGIVNLQSQISFSLENTKTVALDKILT